MEVKKKKALLKYLLGLSKQYTDQALLVVFQIRGKICKYMRTRKGCLWGHAHTAGAFYNTVFLRQGQGEVSVYSQLVKNFFKLGGKREGWVMVLNTR